MGRVWDGYGTGMGWDGELDNIVQIKTARHKGFEMINHNKMDSINLSMKVPHLDKYLYFHGLVCH